MLWYNRKPHPLFKDYADIQAQFHNLSNPLDRVLYACKCIGYLDCLFNRKVGLKYKDYKYLKNKLYSLMEYKINNSQIPIISYLNIKKNQ